jgi:hypothetical protein
VLSLLHTELHSSPELSERPFLGRNGREGIGRSILEGGAHKGDEIGVLACSVV